MNDDVIAYRKSIGEEDVVDLVNLGDSVAEFGPFKLAPWMAHTIKFEDFRSEWGIKLEQEIG